MDDRQLLRLDFVDPFSIGPNRLNWRRHPEEQRAALAQSLDQVGWVKPLVWNERTGQLIDGHMRLAEAQRRHLPAVPVIVGSWSDAEERKILATLDPIGLMAEGDSAAFALLLGQLDDATGPLMELLGATASALGIHAEPEVKDGEGQDATQAEGEAGAEPPPVSLADVPDTVFPSSNEWGVPDLLPGHQARAVDFPVTQWGTIGGSRAMPGTWSFYVDDERFEPLWRDPTRPLRSGAVAVIEPNFSTHEQHPRAYVLWQVYRKRWLARWWQSQGLRTWVDLNVHREFRGLNLLGVPRGWRAYANRAHAEGDGLVEEYELAREHAGSEEILYLVYGGGKAVKQLCGERGWDHVPEQFDEAKRRRREQGS